MLHGSYYCAVVGVSGQYVKSAPAVCQVVQFASVGHIGRVRDSRVDSIVQFQGSMMDCVLDPPFELCFGVKFVGIVTSLFRGGGSGYSKMFKDSIHFTVPRIMMSLYPHV